MEQIEIKASLVKEGEIEKIRFDFDDKPELNLNDEKNQVQVKELFVKLLNELVKNNITIIPDIPESRKNDLYGEVCQEYINQLNSEISRVRSRLSQNGLVNEDNSEN
ncbi:hypothetical protein [Paraeggerthella sp.]|uniref:hypothetical protein n=1 Tax=Paraeggerthella sp. TaxID=2897350 RepID=UPI003AB1F942